MSTSFFDQPGWTRGIFNDHKYRYYAHKAAPSKPTFLLIHGFPTGPFTYRFILPLLLDAGFGVVLPELLGYGESDKDTSSFDKFARKSVTNDFVAMLDEEKVEKVIVVAHNISTTLAATFVRLHKDRSLGLVLVSVSYVPTPPTGMSLTAYHALTVPIIGYKSLGYWELLLKPDGPKVMLDHFDSFLSIMYAKDPAEWRDRFCPPGTLEETLLTDYSPERADWFVEIESELAPYLTQTGLEGPLTWYHSFTSSTLNFFLEISTGKQITVPYLSILGTKDVAHPPVVAETQRPWCDDLTTREFDEGHWMLEGDPKGVMEAIVEWMTEKGLM